MSHLKNLEICSMSSRALRSFAFCFWENDFGGSDWSRKNQRTVIIPGRNPARGGSIFPGSGADPGITTTRLHPAVSGSNLPKGPCAVGRLLFRQDRTPLGTVLWAGRWGWCQLFLPSSKQPPPPGSCPYFGKFSTPLQSLSLFSGS